ncbi:hypothetical protein DM780_01345 [Blattabacterium punctulatus]|nr:hypothetical protein DM780_01345 [Blattabacterium punctulatus]
MFLPKKFKITISIPINNDIDMYFKMILGGGFNSYFIYSSK